MEGGEERGGQEEIKKHGDETKWAGEEGEGEKLLTEREKMREEELKGQSRDGDSKVREPKGAVQSKNTNTVSVWLLNLAKENRLPLFLQAPRGDANWQELCLCVIL